jgi:hypothetical protein
LTVQRFQIWSHTRLCTDDSGQEPAQRGLATELIDPVLRPPEDDPSHQELPEDLSAHRDLPPEELSLVGEAHLHLALKLLEVPGGHRPETFQPGQFGL